MSAKAIFYDPQRKRWRRLRRVFDAIAVLLTIVLFTFIYSSFRGADLGTLKLDEVKRPIHALKEKEQQHTKKPTVAHRKIKRPASQVVLNSGEGIRAAFYVVWDAGSFASLREYCRRSTSFIPNGCTSLRTMAISSASPTEQAVRHRSRRPHPDG